MSTRYRKSYTARFALEMNGATRVTLWSRDVADVCGQLDAFFEHTPACTVYHNILCGRNIPLCPVSLSLR